MRTILLVLMVMSLDVFASEKEELALASNHVRPWLQAPIIESHLPLDIAIQGFGFFIFQDQETNQNFYSLDGKITMSHDGYLVQKETGYRLLGYKEGALEPIQISKYTHYEDSLMLSIKIALDGVIKIVYQNGEEKSLHQIAIALFQYPRKLQRLAKHVFQDNEESGSPLIGKPQSFRRGSIYSSQLAVLIESYYKMNMDKYKNVTKERFPVNFRDYY